MLDGNKIGRQNSICNLNIKPFLLHFFLHPFNPSPSRELSRSSSASNTWWGEEAWLVHCTIQGIDQTLFSLCVGVRVSVCPSLALYVDHQFQHFIFWLGLLPLQVSILFILVTSRYFQSSNALSLAAGGARLTGK